MYFLPCLISTIGISLGSLLLVVLIESSVIPSRTSSGFLYLYPPAWSTSWFTPQEKTKEHNEWKWDNITMACTTSAKDQLSLPFVSFWEQNRIKISYWKLFKQLLQQITSADQTFFFKTSTFFQTYQTNKNLKLNVCRILSNKINKKLKRIKHEVICWSVLSTT